MADPVKLKRYKAYRDSAVNEIKSLSAIAVSAKTDKSKHTLFKIRFHEIEDIRSEFVKQHVNILTLLSNDASSNLEIEDDVRTLFIENYYEIKTIYSDLFEDVLNQSSNHSPNATNTAAQVKLPKIELKSFDGDYREFNGFIDLFNSLVHNNNNLSDVEKFNYLISSLRGSPLALVQRLKMTSANYSIAYKNLTTEYNNVRMIAQAHWHDIDNFPKLNDDSADNIQKLIETFEQNLAALSNLGFMVDQWDFVLSQLLFKKMSPSLVTRFELEYASCKITPPYETIIKFLNKNRSALNTIAMSTENNVQSFNKKQNKNSSSPKSSFLNSAPRKSFFVKESNNKCSLCTENHFVYNCRIFQNKSAHDKFKFAKENKLCTNCLSSIHTSKFCRSTSNCRICNKRHHTSLHMDNLVHSNGITSNPSPCTVTPSTSKEISESPVVKNYSLQAKGASLPSSVLLGTFYVNVKDKFGNFQIVRGLLDCGSQISIIARRTANRLMLPKQKSSIQILGLGETCPNENLGQMTITLQPLTGKANIFVDVVIVDKICDTLPTSKFDIHSWDILKNISPNRLADSQFHIPDAIDILLGADIFPYIISGKTFEFPGEPVGIDTIFGVVLMGRVNLNPCVNNVTKTFYCSVKENELEISDSIKLLWEVESVPTVHVMSPQDKLCEEIFKNTYFRTTEGHFVVSLPFKQPNPTFPYSKTLALNRFRGLEHRLLKQQELYREYCSFMKDYLDQGHMSIAEPLNEDHSYYIPHFCVTKSDSPTTKLRVVFNASAKVQGQRSLNDCLYIGPKLQKDLRSILLRFRLHNIVFCTDIKQMYRKILINPHDYNYQRILWRFESTDPIQEYILKTVTYGVSSSPYLALRTMHELANIESVNFPRAAQVILNDSYIDDIISGDSSLKGANTLVNELVSLCQKAGIELRKWSSNDPKLLSQFPAESLSTSPIAFEENAEQECSVKVLGLLWNPVTDCFSFKASVLERQCTKRNLLSELARFFDPLGFLTPVTFFLKYLIQRLWLSGAGWDQPPDAEVVRIWNQYKSQLPAMSNIRIPRCLMINNIPVQVHGFCDASERGYAAVIYFRYFENNTYHIKFISSKSKVSPIKTLSIPKLELCAAVLLTKLLSWILDTYRDKIKVEKVIAWSDSAITLAWLQSSPHRWKTFVANRVSYIQDKFPTSMWHHVSSENNPADLGSRGLLPTELINNTFWFQGPSFLKSDVVFSEVIPTVDTVLEERRICLTSISKPNFFDDLIENISNFKTLQHIIAYIIRFITNCKEKSRPSNTLTLNTDEIHYATLCLVKRTQQIYFSEELSSKRFSKPLRKLNAFIDTQGILRVGGRLNYLPGAIDKKHPALLSSKSRFTHLLIKYIHEKYFHAGITTVHYILSQTFWILSARQIIRSVLSKCFVCWKRHPENFQPPMGNLPVSRITQLKPFSHSGVDYGGPIPITIAKHRGNKTIKAYICLFICLATKAIHIELATELSTESFLCALRRFIARRGRCSHIYSDCGTNFLGASKILKLLKDAASQEYIKWHFNPPSAPHFGGLWEAGIKSVKSHLFKVIGQQILSYEELNTVLIQIEALLNSRPLSPQSTDPNDLSALSPGVFLTMEPLTAVCEPDVLDVPLNRLSRWQMLQRLHQSFWQRWKKEYLHTLQQRSKWYDPSVPIAPGTMVLIKNEASPPTQWPLARILDLHPGVDGINRVATIKTATGILTRPVVKLCPLPEQ